MQYLVVFNSNAKFASEGRPSDFADRELEEQAQARELYASGALRQAWALDSPPRGAVTLWEVESLEKLQSLVASFPLVQVDYAQFEIIPLGPHAAFSPHSTTKSKN